VRVEDFPPRKLFFPMVAEVPAGLTTNIYITPTKQFRPRRLVYGGAPGAFNLLNIMVGKNSQLDIFHYGGVPMDIFKDPFLDPEVVRSIKFLVEMDEQREKWAGSVVRAIDSALGNIGTCDVCRVSMQFTLSVRNVTREPRTTWFSAIVYGDEVPEESAGRSHFGDVDLESVGD